MMPRKKSYDDDKKIREQYRNDFDTKQSFTEYKKRLKYLKREGLL